MALRAYRPGEIGLTPVSIPVENHFAMHPGPPGGGTAPVRRGSA